MTSPVLALDHVSFEIKKTRVLDDVSLSLWAGSLTALTGPNGAGKSTLLKLMAGVLPPTAGHITAPRSLAYLPQLSAAQRDFPLLVGQVVASGFWPFVRDVRPITKGMRAKAEAALAQVGLDGFAAKQLSELSGGQFQRVMFARVIVQNASVILLDEPFNAIDQNGQDVLISILKHWHQEGRTILCVTHDTDLVAAHFPQHLICEGGHLRPSDASPDLVCVSCKGAL